MPTNDRFLRVVGSRLVDGRGNPVLLRGVAIGGWLNMENFITGYSGNESLMRATLRDVLGESGYDLFFEQLLGAFFKAEDAQLLASAHLNAVRIPVNYRHFEDDDRPFQVRDDGFRHLDKAIKLCAEWGIYSIIDLHAVPGAQNHHWHSDNPTHVPSFWAHPHFQDRVVHLWEVFAEHYKDNPWVAGYNLINEPADESRSVLRRFYKRLVSAIRAVDPHHVLFLDGNTYSTEFDVFDEAFENTVYVCHDYVLAGLTTSGMYPGEHRGIWHDRSTVEQKFMQRTAYCRQTGTPIWVGEFGPTYTGDAEVDLHHSQILADQLAIYGEHGASWSLWTYKDIGRQGLVTVEPSSPYLSRFGDFVAKKHRLAADAWGSDGEGPLEVTRPFQAMISREFPTFDPYPFGRWEWIRTLILNIAVAQPLAYEYAELFRGQDADELATLAQSFAVENCSVRRVLYDQLSRAAARPGSERGVRQFEPLASSDQKGSSS